MSEEQFEAFLERTAPQYRPPPPTPRDEIWARIEASRRPKAGGEVIDLASRRPSRPRWNWIALAAAAVLAIGIGIGRFLAPPTATGAPAVPIIGARPTGEPPTAETATFRLATVAALSQAKTLLVDYDADRITDDFQDATRDLLATTRLLLASPRLTDPATRQLLEDLELVLVQVARLSRSGQGEERGFIDDGMAERAIRQRLGSAIPAGPTA